MAGLIFTITPVNDAPDVTIPSAVSIEENIASTGIDLTAATDPDGPSPITYTITGGDDQSLFTINASNELVFNAAPDYETPLDVGTNNVYDVQVTVSDGNVADDVVQNIAVTILDVALVNLFNYSVIISDKHIFL